MPKQDAAAVAQQEAVTPYGVQPNDNTKSFRERLMERFQPQEFVRVKNVDDSAFQWQYMPQHNEDFEFTPDPMKITRRSDPEMWYIDPGQEEVLVGENAYIMIEGLYKKMVASKKIAATPDQPATQARNFNFSSADQQEEWINKIYRGKAQLAFNQPQPEVPVQQPVAQTAPQIAPMQPKENATTNTSPAPANR